MKAGFTFAYYTRIAAPAAYIGLILLSLVYPIIALAILLSVGSDEKLNAFKTPSYSALGCPLSPCINIVYGPTGNATAMAAFEALIDKLERTYGKALKTYAVRTAEEMQSYFVGDNRGKVGIGLLQITDSLVFFSREKQSGMTMSDSKIVNSLFLYLKAMMDDFPIDKQKYVSVSDMDVSTMAPLIILFTFSFLVVSLVYILTIGVLKDKRRYEYLICNGLRRTKFWFGIMLVGAIESLVLLLVLCIIFAASGILSPDPIKSFFLPLFGYFAVLAQNIGFLWFVASFTNSVAAFALTFMFPCMIGYAIMTLVQVFVKTSVLRVLNVILEIIFPFISLQGFFSQLYVAFLDDNLMVQQGMPPMSFLDMLSYETPMYLPLWTNIIFSVASLVMYCCLGILIEATNKFANYPTRRHFFTKRRQQGLLEPFRDEFSLKADNLTVEFTVKKKVTVALDQLNLNFETNQATIGLIAENGAGKTTLFRTALGAVRAKTGKVLINNEEAVECDERFYKDIAVVFQENIIFYNFTVERHMKMMSYILGEKESRISECLDKMGLLKELKKKTHKLSGGMQRRLNIAVSLLKSHPRLYMFDEPACGVDIESRKFLWEFLKGLKVITLITTHAMEEVEELCDKVIILKKGKLIIQGDLLDVKRRLCFGYKILLKEEQIIDEYVVNSFTKAPNIQYCGREIRIPYGQEDMIVQILQQVDDKCIVRSPSLTEAFLNVQTEDYNTEVLT